LYIHGNHNIRFKIYTLMNYTFIVLTVYDLKLIHSSFCGAQFKIDTFMVATL
ncbi:unnamed protein product, partial [Rotaria magnacalcarata]